MSEKFRTFAGCMRNLIVHIVSRARRLVCMLGLVCGLASCGWQEAKEVIVLADSLDQTEHVIYSDTAALGKAIRSLDNPFGRLLMSNTLGKAYYYMGRNLSFANEITDAAKCYIEADHLQIDDPIYRGRVNSCMGYICAQNNNDSLALIFYERASENFKESGNDWRYALNMLDRSEANIYLNRNRDADSLLQIVHLYQFDDTFSARYLETRGLYFYKQQKYDSALVYLKKGLDYWESESKKSFGYLKIMQIYYDLNELQQAIPYAKLILSVSNNPNYISNAYYCLMQDAKNKNNTELLSQYAHSRTDAQRLMSGDANKYAEAVPILEEHLQNPYPWRWVWITLTSILIVCFLLALGAIVYHKRAHVAYQQLDQFSTHMENQEARLNQEMYYRQLAEKLSIVIDRYHTPHKRWKEYTILKRDLNPWLHLWLRQLDTLPLSDREKVYCTISLIYSRMTDTEIAAYLCYDKHGIRTFKQRIAKKLGTTAAYLLDYLRHLPLN